MDTFATLPKTVDDLLLDIINFKCRPQVYKVFVQRLSYEDCFEAILTFRSGDPDADLRYSVRRNSSLEALTVLYQQLVERWGVCPACGEQRKERRK